MRDWAIWKYLFDICKTYVAQYIVYNMTFNVIYSFNNDNILFIEGQHGELQGVINRFQSDNSNVDN